MATMRYRIVTIVTIVDIVNIVNILRGANMSVMVNGQPYYRTAEVCRITSVSRNTLFRWAKDGFFGEPRYRDWRGWRLFTEAQVDKLKAKTSQILVGDNPNKG